MRVPFINRPPHVSVVRLAGVIASGGWPGARQLNDAALARLIDRAFCRGRPVAVALAINSPGGSPVQSSLIAGRIRRLAEERSIPVYAFVEDIAASGGYWLATAADQIFIDRSSIIGSIGVISSSFGFHRAMERIGVERRVHTAGKDKSMLDPFRPERPADVRRLKLLQRQIHEAFIDQVKSRRGERLKGDNLFTGEVWIGTRAVEVGLADGIDRLVPRMKRLFGDKTRFNVHGPRKSLLRRFGTQVVTDALGAAEERALWAQYGL